MLGEANASTLSTLHSTLSTLQRGAGFLCPPTRVRITPLPCDHTCILAALFEDALDCPFKLAGKICHLIRSLCDSVCPLQTEGPPTTGPLAPRRPVSASVLQCSPYPSPCTCGAGSQEPAPFFQPRRPGFLVMFLPFSVRGELDHLSRLWKVERGFSNFQPSWGAFYRFSSGSFVIPMPGASQPWDLKSKGENRVWI